MGVIVGVGLCGAATVLAGVITMVAGAPVVGGWMILGGMVAWGALCVLLEANSR